MATTTTYVTLAAYKTWQSIDIADDDAIISSALEAASRGIDTICSKTFWVDENATTRVFRPARYDDEYDFGLNLSEATSVTVKVDTTDDGTFDETWSVGTDFIFLPENLVEMGNKTLPITGLRLIGKTLPVGGYRSRLEVVGKWGWLTVPTAVQEATKLVTAELYARRGVPFGIAGFDAAGVVELIRETPRVYQLLQKYTRAPRF